MNVKCSLRLIVNDKIDATLVKEQPFSIMESDEIVFELEILEGDLGGHSVEMYIEDYLVKLNKEDGKYCSEKYRYFRESCGESRIFVYIDQDVCEFLLNIKAKKLDDDIVKMMEYIDNRIKNAWRIDLARTRIEVGSEASITPAPEMLLSKAEELCGLFWEKKADFKKYSRKRLSAMSRYSFYDNCNHVDPHDIINNLDLLTPSLGQSDVMINKKNYTISSVLGAVLVENTNLIENQILMGSLYSICRKIQNIIEEKFHYEKEYKDLGFDYKNLVSSVDSNKIRERIERVLNQAKSIILYLEKNLGFVYNGEIRPVVTHFVRGNKFYRMFFEKIDEWYNLGEPSVGGDSYFVKLKSISKIYEIYCLFRIVETLEKLGWVRHCIKPCNSNLVKYFHMENTNDKGEAISIKILYELDIYEHNSKSRNFDLVVTNSKYKNLRPDFVIKIENNDKIRYGIMDAKYSTDRIVREKHLPELVEKYWGGIRVKNHEVLAAGVLVIFALYAKSYQNAQAREYFSLDESYGLDAALYKQPLKAGILVNLDRDIGIKRAVEALLSMASAI